MNQDTLDYYNRNAHQIADSYEIQRPHRLYELISLFFKTADHITLDLGCGSGQDAAHLKSKDYKVIGLDASEEMIREAKIRHPGIEFRNGSLPALSDLMDACVDNLLCSGVFMHLGEEDLIPAAINCRRVMKEQGVLILTFRDNDSNSSQSPGDTRLFTIISPGRLAMLFESLGMRVLYQEMANDLTGRGHQWQTLIVQNTMTPFSDGIARIRGTDCKERVRTLKNRKL